MIKSLIVAGGCFWGMEDLFRMQPGVTDTEVGFAGGDNDNPTTLNRQSNDVGTSYRSAIFYDGDEQKRAADQAIERASGMWGNSVTTTPEPLITFYSAEEYHQDYLQKNPGGYTCHYERRLK